MPQNTMNVLKDLDAQVGAFGCNGAAPQASVELTGTIPAAVVTTGAALDAYGFTEAQANAIVAMVNALRSRMLQAEAALIANGILVDAA